VFIVSPLAADGAALFEALARSPQVFTPDGGGDTVLAGIDALGTESRGSGADRLTEADTTPGIVAIVEERFHDALRDRSGARASGAVRMLDAAPTNAVRIPFLKAVFPDALFVYLHREWTETVGGMLDAWRSGRFVTHPCLPAWDGAAWSLPLVSGWRELSGRAAGAAT
jgi:hypothetical protein